LEVLIDHAKWSVYVCVVEESDVGDWETCHDVDFVE
jgi:hypothetical protein